MKIQQAQTAIDNYHFHVLPDIVNPMHAKILKAMRTASDLSGLEDFTIGEIAHMTGLDKSNVSARRNEMLKQEHAPIELNGTRKCTISGITCQTVKLA